MGLPRMSKRRTHSPEFKTRVAMEAISGRKTIQEIAADHAIHPIQVSQWKKQLLDGASELFTRGKKSKDQEESQAKEAELFQQIGKLQMELEWLKKKSQLLWRPWTAEAGRSRPPRAQYQPPMCAAGPTPIDALQPADTGAGIDIAHHGHDRCSLPGGSLQR